MPAVHVRDVPEEVLAALRRRAASHGRSLQRELLEILEAATETAPPGAPLPPLQLTMAEGPAETDQGTWRREEIYGDDER